MQSYSCYVHTSEVPYLLFGPDPKHGNILTTLSFKISSAIIIIALDSVSLMILGPSCWRCKIAKVLCNGIRNPSLNFKMRLLTFTSN